MRTTRPPAQRPPIVAAAPIDAPPRSAPAVAATPTPTASPAQAPAVAATDQRRTVTVRPRDSLWQIAARSLGARASDAAVAAAWPRWWATNRDVIGADPDLIHPGEQLTPPAATPSARP
jgi:nucleoid-associated protein YgaU